MVIAVKPPPLVKANGTLLRNTAAPIAMGRAARTAAERGSKRGPEKDAQNRAKLMLAAKANLFVTDKVPKGSFIIVDPNTLPDAERKDCPFDCRTLVLHPDDIEQAIKHFEGRDAPAGRA